MHRTVQGDEDQGRLLGRWGRGSMASGNGFYGRSVAHRYLLSYPNEGPPEASLSDLLPGAPAAVLPAHSVVMARHDSCSRSSRYGHGHGPWSTVLQSEGARLAAQDDHQIQTPPAYGKAQALPGVGETGREGQAIRPQRHPSEAQHRRLPQPSQSRDMDATSGIAHVIREVDRRPLTE